MKATNYLISWMHTPSQVQKTGMFYDANMYWRCVFCLFESSHRNNKELFHHILYVNKMPPEKIDGVSTAEMIKAFKIEILTIDEQSLPPQGYYKSWSSQFLLLDILRQMSSYVKPEDRVVILDSDVIFSKPVHFDFLSDIDTNRALIYTIDYPIDKEVNGTSLRQLREHSKEITGNEDPAVFCSGGEFICFKGEIIDQLSTELQSAYSWSLHRFKKGLPKFNTEEHLFSFAYWRLGLNPYTANKYIKRLWTDFSSAVNLEAGDEHRMLWHLPGEKKNGFIRYFRLMAKNNNSLQGYESSLKSIFRIKPTLRDKIAMMSRIPIKKTLKLLKSI